MRINADIMDKNGFSFDSLADVYFYITSIIDYLESHNKNYNKTQYEKICTLKEVMQGLEPECIPTISFSENELMMLSNGILALMNNANEARTLLNGCDSKSDTNIATYMNDLQALNSKVCKMMNG